MVMNFLLGLTVVLVSLTTYGMIFWTESVFPFNPLIETHVPAGFKLENFDRIQQGITKAEVLQLIPPPFTKADSQIWSYSGERHTGFGDFAHFELTIEFTTDNRVKKIGRIIHYN